MVLLLLFRLLISFADTNNHGYMTREDFLNLIRHREREHNRPHDAAAISAVQFSISLCRPLRIAFLCASSHRSLCNFYFACSFNFSFIENP